MFIVTQLSFRVHLSVLEFIVSIASADVVRQNFRESLWRSEKCATFTQYNFKWDSLSRALSERELGVEKAILRAYIQVIQRHVREGENVNVTLTATMNIDTGENDTVGDLGVFTGQQEINVANGSDSWIELNVIEGTRAIWRLVQNYTKVQVVIKAEVNCTQQKKVPIKFVNPAEVPLHQQKRREWLLLFQPFLVVTVRDKVKMKEITSMADDTNIMELVVMDRKKRNIYSHCTLSNFSIVLHHIGLTNVLNPYQVNIRKCSGHCSHTILRRFSSLGTNHAKLMASVNLLQRLDPTSMVSANGRAEEPCCVPSEYDSIYLHMFNEFDGSFVINRYNNFIATSCGCQ